MQNYENTDFEQKIAPLSIHWLFWWKCYVQQKKFAHDTTEPF